MDVLHRRGKFSYNFTGILTATGRAWKSILLDVLYYTYTSHPFMSKKHKFRLIFRAVLKNNSRSKKKFQKPFRNSDSELNALELSVRTVEHSLSLLEILFALHEKTCFMDIARNKKQVEVEFCSFTYTSIVDHPRYGFYNMEICYLRWLRLRNHVFSGCDASPCSMLLPTRRLVAQTRQRLEIVSWLLVKFWMSSARKSVGCLD